MITKKNVLLVFFLDQYNFIVELAEKLLSPTLLNLLKFSLSIRYYSPTVELFNQVRSSYHRINVHVHTVSQSIPKNTYLFCTLSFFLAMH